MVKIQSGKHKYRTLEVPKDGVRPTLARLRKTIFDILQEEVIDAEILYLFSGSGSMGLEALSRGAKHVTFVEKSKVNAAIIKKNIQHLGEEEHSLLLIQDVFLVVPRFHKQGKRFDIIFADPPYSKGFANELIDLLDTYPLLKEGASFFLEDRFIKGEKLKPSKTMSLQSEREIGGANLYHFRL